jgi:hypothetical protein
MVWVIRLPLVVVVTVEPPGAMTLPPEGSEASWAKRIAGKARSAKAKTSVLGRCMFFSLLLRIA